MNDYESREEVAVVVGSTGAFGRVLVERLCRRGLGVVAVGRDGAALATLARELPAVRPCVADVADDAAIESIRAEVRKPVRMVVHGPGVAVAGGILAVPTRALAEAVDIKVGGLLRLVRAVDERLRAHSRIVAIAGHYGLEPTSYAAAAGVANAALANVMRQLSLAYGARGITAHTIFPGPADTERLRRVAASRAEQRGCGIEDVLEEMRAESSIGALTTPEQVAWAIALLLDVEADAMTGSGLMLDSGRRRGLP